MLQHGMYWERGNQIITRTLCKLHFVAVHTTAPLGHVVLLAHTTVRVVRLCVCVDDCGRVLHTVTIGLSYDSHSVPFGIPSLPASARHRQTVPCPTENHLAVSVGVEEWIQDMVAWVGLVRWEVGGSVRKVESVEDVMCFCEPIECKVVRGKGRLVFKSFIFSHRLVLLIRWFCWLVGWYWLVGSLVGWLVGLLVGW